MASTDVQEVLSSAQQIDGREKVDGDNPAYYCGPRSQDQLFSIEEFTLAPNPPPVNSRFFAHIYGFVPDVPGLDDARLKLSALMDGTEPGVFEAKLSDFPNIVVRIDRKYGGPLKPGPVELIGDYFFLSMILETGNYTFRAESWLPDGRVLFSFEASLFLKGDL